MKKFIMIGLIAASTMLAGCVERIETGKIGVRVNASKQIEGTELLPGSWNQTIIGSVIEFPVKDVTVSIENKTPLTADNSALDDFDITVVYSINQTSVAELYSKKANSFHAYDAKEKDTYLMFRYMETLVNNASYKVVRQYKSLEVADNRAKIEKEIQQVVQDQLKAENLDKDLSLTVVQVRNIQPNKEILKAASDFVRSQNELKIKENEVKLAKLESERMNALAQNSGQSIAYMNATALLNISEGVKAGKVQTIVVPADFRGMVNVGK